MACCAASRGSVCGVCLQLGARAPKLQYDGQWWQGRQEGKGMRHYFNGETYSGGQHLALGMQQPRIGSSFKHSGP